MVQLIHSRTDSRGCKFKKLSQSHPRWEGHFNGNKSKLLLPAAMIKLKASYRMNHNSTLLLSLNRSQLCLIRLQPTQQSRQQTCQLWGCWWKRWKETWEVPDSKIWGSSDGSDQEKTQGRNVDVWEAARVLWSGKTPHQSCFTLAQL